MFQPKEYHDGSTIEIEKDEDKRLVEEWYKDNPIKS